MSLGERVLSIRKGEGEPEGEYESFLENEKKLQEMTPLSVEERIRRAFLAGSHSRLLEIQDLLEAYDDLKEERAGLRGLLRRAVGSVRDNTPLHKQIMQAAYDRPVSDCWACGGGGTVPDIYADTFDTDAQVPCECRERDG